MFRALVRSCCSNETIQKDLVLNDVLGVNCKKAHLACDVSRPCKRCIGLGKADTCYDIKHKKRGRPRIRSKSSGDNRSDYEVMCGTIQTPTFTASTRSPPPTTAPATTPSPQKLEQQSPLSDSQHHSQPALALAPSPPPPSPSIILQQQQQQPSEFLEPFDLDFSFDDLTFPDDALVQGYLMPHYLTDISLNSSACANNNSALGIQIDDMAMQVVSCADDVEQQEERQTTMPQSLPSPRSESSDIKNVEAKLVLSMDVCCARVSEQVTEMWGYYPQELAHRSLYDFVSPKDTGRLARLHRMLLDNVADVARQSELPQTERTTSDLFHNARFDTLISSIANGSSTFSDTLHIKKRSGDEDLYEILVSIGGGLGADLARSTSLSRLYIVAQLRKYEYQVRARSPTVTDRRDDRSKSPSSLGAQTLTTTVLRPQQQRTQPYSCSTITPISPSPPKINIAPITGLLKRPPTITALPRSFSSPAAPVNHPTTQYFLQTSSSTLNAAAWAAQSYSRNRCFNGPTAVHTADNDKALGAREPSRTVEMSIRSLLC
ncbi:hypothetical protein BX666DRAFT_1967440 [Dichotomocladium elegans]|nr:hypothetical protein BX666DRAFT_1967440 [Dichotomocladium elegans]